MPQVIFLPHAEHCPEGAVIEAQPGETVLDAALRRSDRPLADARVQTDLQQAQSGLRLLQLDWEEMQIGPSSLADLERYAEMRGRAFAEWNEQQIEQPMNLITLALAKQAVVRGMCKASTDGNRCEATMLDELSRATRDALGDTSPFLLAEVALSARQD